LDHGGASLNLEDWASAGTVTPSGTTSARAGRWRGPRVFSGPGSCWILRRSDPGKPVRGPPSCGQSRWRARGGQARAWAAGGSAGGQLARGTGLPMDACDGSATRHAPGQRDGDAADGAPDRRVSAGGPRKASGGSVPSGYLQQPRLRCAATRRRLLSWSR
jgi:hypothetical protein